MKIFALLVYSFLAAAGPWTPGPAGDFKFEASDFAKQTLYRNSKLVSLDMLPGGAYGPNKESETTKAPWFIENQRWGEDAIIAGIVRDDVDAIERGLKIFEWGFAKQEKNGAFVHRDAFHSSAFFVAAVARSIMHLQGSKYQKQFQGRIEGIKPKLLLTAKWMLSPEVEKDGIKKDAPYTHRFYLNAAALGISGQLFQDESLRTKAREYIERALLLQDKSGSNPEKRGSDTGYHALGLVYAARYYSIEANDQLRPKLETMAKQAISWLLSKVKEDGSIDSSSNTRTGDNGELGRDGKKKTTPYYSIYKSFAYWGMVLEQPPLIVTAQKIFNYNKTHKQ